MANKLTYGATEILLDDDLLWPNEFDWAPVQQAQRYSVTGSLIVESAARLAGRPITLEGGDNYAWLARSTLLALRTAAAIPGQTFSLLYAGVTRSVKFDHAAGAITATPVIDYSDPGADDVYVATLKFIEV